MGRRRAVAVTGIGVVAPTGIGKESFWSRILQGPSAVDRITRFDCSTFSTRIAAEVRDPSYRELIPPAKLRNTPLATQYAMAATALALRDASVAVEQYDPLRRGVVLGTSIGGWHEALQQHAVLAEKGAGRVNPFMLNGSANHGAAVEVAVIAQAKGTHATFSTGCCGSTHAIGHAADLVALGELDFCVTGGTEAPISPIVVAAMSRLRELSEANDSPAEASRPFDCAHEGFVLGEGSAILILEECDHARRRGAPVYAEILGHASGVDAADPFRVDGSGDVGVAALEACLRKSELTAEQIDYVCANANASPHLDRKESNVLRRVFGAHLARLPVSSIKAVIGHPFGASGAFQTAAVCLAIQHHQIPPTHNIVMPDPECNLDVVPNVPRRASIRHAVVSSHGFGGLNAYIALRAAGAASLTASAAD